ncbi:unnamed protein product [Schistocephalus solidus]|uniref:Cyclin-dependent kinase 5 activator 1 n=1 Tax=Schistocephalus solidus TaxID=70667 RepID=A0A183SP30_SCHSO|nr:unnamed protein product [Schistocephalus solidus]
MGTTHSHSASVRVSPVCTYQHCGSNEQRSAPMLEISRSTGSEPFLSSSRSSFSRVAVATDNTAHGRREVFFRSHPPTDGDFGFNGVSRVISGVGFGQESSSMCKTNDFVGPRRPSIAHRRADSLHPPDGFHDHLAYFDSGTNWKRHASQRKAKSKPFKQTSYNSTNSSYIPDVSPDNGSLDQQTGTDAYSSMFVTANEHLQCHSRFSKLQPENTVWNQNGGHAFDQAAYRLWESRNGLPSSLRRNEQCFAFIMPIQSPETGPSSPDAQPHACSPPAVVQLSRDRNELDILPCDPRYRLAQRRHFSELDLHLQGPSASVASPQTRLPNSAAYNLSSFECPDLTTQNTQLSAQSVSEYQKDTVSMQSPTLRPRIDHDDCMDPYKSQINQGSFYYTEKSIPDYGTTTEMLDEKDERQSGPFKSLFSSEADLISEGDAEYYHDYVNLPSQPQAPHQHQRTRSRKIPEVGLANLTPLSKPDFEESDNTQTRPGAARTIFAADTILPNPSSNQGQERRPSKSRWRLLTRGKSLTKSLSCYALKFFNQQTRTFELIDAPLQQSQKKPKAAATTTGDFRQSLEGETRARSEVLSSEPPESEGLWQKDIGLSHDAPLPDVFDDLDNLVQRALYVNEETRPMSGVYREKRRNLMNRSLSAFAKREIVNHKQVKVAQKRAPPSSWKFTKRDRITLLQTSTRELLYCLSMFILQQCDSLCVTHKSPLFPEDIVAWIKDIDRALLQQGWTDITFLSPANIVFLFVLLKGSINFRITCSRELHSIVMVCLYLSYGYMGNEISYPLKPFLNAEILYSMLHEKEPQRLRTMNSANSIITRNPKITNHFRDQFWEKCLKVIEAKSREMLQLNADPIVFTESIAELRSYGTPALQSA